MPMNETRIELTGWKAVAGLAVFLAIAGVRFSMRFPTITNDGRETVRAWLVKDYEGRGPKALAQVVSDYRAGLPAHLPERPAAEPKVDFRSIRAHGWRDAMVVRAEVTVDGAPPPDDRPIRYVFLTTKFDGGWMVMSESSAFNYYEALVR
jgi:hypothetical protein